jgi:membrane-associated phospholipid phosphatase
MPISDRLRQEMDAMWSDTRNYYTWPTLRSVALAVGGASILANTPLDQDFRDWYQEDVRGGTLNEFAGVAKHFGDGRIALPACVALGLAGALHDETRWGSGLADFSARTGRAIGVGTPTLLLLQFGLGGDRPGRSEDGSYWRPLDHSHGTSGHAFIGAVPFITGAQMTDDRCLKGLLYFCSVLPGWSRVNDDEHYLSQVLLGWWVAYLACDAVNATQHQDDRLLIAPVASPDMVGASVMYRY